jgi:antitoxin ParD1/3/4
MAISADLGPKLEAVVEDLVTNGRYNSKSEVLREGVRLVQEREAALERLHAELDKGRESVRRGDVHNAEDVFDRLEARIQAMIDAEKEEGGKAKRRRAS